MCHIYGKTIEKSWHILLIFRGLMQCTYKYIGKIVSVSTHNTYGKIYGNWKIL